MALLKRNQIFKYPPIFYIILYYIVFYFWINFLHVRNKLKYSSQFGCTGFISRPSSFNIYKLCGNNLLKVKEIKKHVCLDGKEPFQNYYLILLNKIKYFWEILLNHKPILSVFYPWIVLVNIQDGTDTELNTSTGIINLDNIQTY